MEKEDANWKKLEKVIAEIQKVLAPNSVVQHGVSVIGKSGAHRKLDISIRDRVGAVPILIVIDCKHRDKHSDLVDRKDVAGFVEQLRDVEADVGVMVTDTGYDSGAQYVAAENKVILKTYREAETTDWESFVGKGAWFNF